MKKIVCELCEGTVFDKIDGRFVCKGCGTSYSAEEAKGMMQEVEDGESTSGASVSSTPQANVNQQQLDNILMLASNAFSASNNEETEKYCNRAIELDASCYKAWLLKGKAIGWSSTIQNPRISEAAHSFKQAVDFAPDENKEEIREEAADELKKLGLACISLRQKRFSQYPDNEELNGFVSDVRLLIDGLAILLAKEDAPEGAFNPDIIFDAVVAAGKNASVKFFGIVKKAESAGVPKEFFTQIATMMGSAAVDAYNQASAKYNQDDHPLQNDLARCMQAIDNCIMLVDMAISASDDDDSADIKRYKNKIIMEEFVINMTGYESFSSTYRSIGLTAESKKFRRDAIDDCKKKIKEAEEKIRVKEEEERKKAEEEKNARVAAYWEAHADEKAKLEAEKKELSEKRDVLQKELDGVNSEIEDVERMKREPVPSEAEKGNIEDQIRDLMNRRAKLGMFAGKEKKQIGEEIASLEGRIDSLKEKIEVEKKETAEEVEKRLAPAKTRKNELDSELAPITKRISAIDAELTKDPEE